MWAMKKPDIKHFTLFFKKKHFSKHNGIRVLFNLIHFNFIIIIIIIIIIIFPQFWEVGGVVVVIIHKKT